MHLRCHEDGVQAGLIATIGSVKRSGWSADNLRGWLEGAVGAKRRVGKKWWS